MRGPYLRQAAGVPLRKIASSVPGECSGEQQLVDPGPNRDDLADRLDGTTETRFAGATAFGRKRDHPARISAMRCRGAKVPSAANAAPPSTADQSGSVDGSLTAPKLVSRLSSRR